MKNTKVVITASLLALSFSASAGKSCSDIVVESGYLQTENVAWGLKERPDLVATAINAYINVCESGKKAIRAGVSPEIVMALANGNAEKEGTPEDLKPVIMKISELAIKNAK